MTPRKTATEIPDDPFLPADYTPPSNTGEYFRMKADGTYNVRILTKPVVGIVGWTAETGGKPLRKRKGEQFEPGEVVVSARQRIVEFWLVAVWNYAAARVQAWEITQSSIITQITDWSRNPKWGSPLHYDLTIKRETKGEKTSYSVQVDPKEPLAPEVVGEWQLAAPTWKPENCFMGQPVFDRNGSSNGHAAQPVTGGLLPGTPVDVVRKRAFAVLGECVERGIFGKEIKANTEDGKERRRRLIADLLGRSVAPEDMTADEWATFANRLDAMLTQHTPNVDDSDIPF